MRRLLTLGHSVRGRVIGFWAAAECGYTRGPEAGQEVRRQLLARSQALGLCGLQGSESDHLPQFGF